ncbi:uncharacterized protein LOC142829453 [Pelodiscus sinensis]|uniref:uncharacterized protein LOC142829453 n=1 Tax=Pelodiscus sinensis TaxID=13735 RepID=UPI003F6B7E22
MEPELLLGRRWPHAATLQLLHDSVMNLLPHMDPDHTKETLLRDAGALSLPPNFFGNRQIWRHETSSGWWDQLIMQLWDDDHCLHNFQMELCAWLAPALKYQDTHLRPAIPLQKHVSIALWKLATPDSYRSVGHQFGVGSSTIEAVLMEVVRDISAELLKRLVRLRDLDNILAAFAALGFLNCGGALNGTHIAICHTAPSSSPVYKQEGLLLHDAAGPGRQPGTHYGYLRRVFGAGI